MMWRTCETCAHSAWRDGKTAVTEVCLICTFGKDGQPTNWKEKTMTNADRIRAMSDEELAKWMAGLTTVGACNDLGIPDSDLCDRKCESCCLAWLRRAAC